METKPTKPKGQAKPNGTPAYEVHRFKQGHSQIVGYARVSTRDQ